MTQSPMQTQPTQAQPTQTQPAQAQWIHYTEQHGNLAGLQDLAQTWARQAGFMGAEILSSPEQTTDAGELYLLVTRWQGPPPKLVLPNGTKGWAFVRLATEITPVG